MRTGQSFSVVLILIAITFTASVYGGIQEFNAAMGRGDYAAAAAETHAIWQTYDKSKTSAVTIAREFAFVNYLAGDYPTAKAFINNLVQSENALVAQDDQPNVSAVLNALIDYKTSATEESRTRLYTSLEKRIDDTGFDSISLVAAEALYTDEWGQGKLSNSEESAKLAAELLDRAGEAAIARKRKAELTAAISHFLLRREKEDYDKLVDLHDAIVGDVDSILDKNQRELLKSLKWITHAWVNSVQALFTSYYSQTGSLIDRDIKIRPLRHSRFGYFYERSSPLDNRPLCSVELDDGKLRYPSAEAYRGIVGSVIVKMDFDEKGRGSNPSILAAIPVDSFSENVLKAAPTFRLKPEKGQDLDQCRLNRQDTVIPITFIIR